MESEPINPTSIPSNIIIEEDVETENKKIDAFLSFMKGKEAVPIVEIRKATNLSYSKIRSIANKLGYKEQKEYIAKERLMTVIRLA